VSSAAGPRTDMRSDRRPVVGSSQTYEPPRARRRLASVRPSRIGKVVSPRKHRARAGSRSDADSGGPGARPRRHRSPRSKGARLQPGPSGTSDLRHPSPTALVALPPSEGHVIGADHDMQRQPDAGRQALRAAQECRDRARERAAVGASNPVRGPKLCHQGVARSG
jgi:hypothetical protein